MKKQHSPLQTLKPRTQPKPFPPRRDYASLSVKDLLDAREAYHVHLSNLENVVATAIGRYLIHEDDWYAKHPPDEPKPADFVKPGDPRTLSNSVVRPWSWPAVLVFVKDWMSLEALGANAVPKTLYLPDGRVVPTCVVLATPDEVLPGSPVGSMRSSPLLGGGYSCIREHQGEVNFGTVACLVKKAGSYYALTNRHVAGGDGEIVKARIRNQLVPIGKSSNIAVDRLLLSAAYPGWVDSHTYLTLDAGLIFIDDVRQWTSQAFGIGEIGEVFDATSRSITLDLVGCPLRGFGAGTGLLEGEVKALFFRYESLGGYEYATDVLIGPRQLDKDDDRKDATWITPFTNTGDSGTLWFYDPPSGKRTNPSEEVDSPDRGARARRLRPIAMQWGGQRTRSKDNKTSAFALASFLSPICKALDVELVRNWSTGHSEYWGKIGHFSIGWKACDEVDGNLGSLMKKNQPRIGFPDDELGKGSQFSMGRGEFVPLADVPDYVWVASSARPSEPVQHFADIDIYDIDGGTSLLERCHQDVNAISATVWKQYFDGFAAQGVGPEEGCLPFRVWQIWEDMVSFLKAKDVLRFVTAAGVLAHYVGDASQPFHCSFMHHGIPPLVKVNGRKYPVPRDSAEFKEFKKSREAKIHAIYEQGMLEIDAPGALMAVTAEVANIGPGPMNIASGKGAAKATIELMHRSQKRLSPEMIIDADDPSLTQKQRAVALWNNDHLRKSTISSLAESVQLLAALWATAWKEGKGNSIASNKLVKFGEGELQKVYRKADFVKSFSLAEMAANGRFE